MFSLRSAVKFGRPVLAAAVAGILAGTQMLAGQIQAAEGTSLDSRSVTTFKDSANLEGHHHYDPRLTVLTMPF
jgi:hypothetical protein